MITTTISEYRDASASDRRLIRARAAKLDRQFAEEETRRERAQLAAVRDAAEQAETNGVLASPADRLTYLLAGRAVFTVVNRNTGNRFTFKVTLAEKRANNEPATWFVAALSGPDNQSHYRYLGKIWHSQYAPNHHKAPADWPTQRVASWLLKQVLIGAELPEGVEILHSGRCGRCGRLLTDPESINRGLGPECASKALH